MKRPLPLTLSIAVAYLTGRRRQTFISMAGVAVGVGFFIAITSMMQGFQNYFISKIVDAAPHIIMKDEFRTAPAQPAMQQYPAAAVEIRGVKPREELRGIRGGERIVSDLQRMPGVHVAPVLSGQVFLRYGSRDLAASLLGIDPAAEAGVSTIERDLIAGSLSDLMTTGNGIILGVGLARNLGARLGSKLTVVSPQGVIMIMKVVGISRTGITAIDYSDAYTLLKKSQILQKRDRRINRIRMRVDDVGAAAGLAARIEARYGWRTEGWQETNENVFSLFRVQNVVMYSVVTAILLVAGFGIYNIISTVVNEKVRDIAILKSMGFGEEDIRRIFLLQGFIVGALGTLLGWALGQVLMDLLAQLKFDMGEQGVIETQRLLLHRSPWYFAAAGVLAVLSSAVSALLPARKAARLNPVDIIRSAA